MVEKVENSGFREVEHTADWELKVWAPDMESLIVEAARGMYHLTDTRLEREPRVKQEIQLEVTDRESLLVDFLTELLYLSETEQVGFDRLDVAVDEEIMKAELEGAPIKAQKKEIKAVTYHKLEVNETDKGLEVNIVFDV